MPKQTLKGRKRVTFALNADPDQSVFVAGSFNNWDSQKRPLKDKDGSGHYAATVLLVPGSYEYKFVIDGDWCMDPSAVDWIANELGSLNSVVRVG